MKCEKMMCDENLTIRDVMMCIDNNTKGIAFIVDQHRRLVGGVTDGDIRRSLLSGAGLNEPIKGHMNRNFVYALNFLDAQQLFHQYGWKIKIIPLVDTDMHVIDYVEGECNPYVPLAKPQLNGNEYNYLMDAFFSTWISSTGKYVTQFEANFARYCGVKYGIATSSGTTALHLALAALGIGTGDEVIVPDITFAATINSIIYTGAIPVIVDIEEDSWCIQPEKIEKAITAKTKAIIPVHIYGQPCDMERICDIARKNDLYVIEDCAEAHGAEWDGKKVGSFGTISCFSFFGNKVITTGEGGMCVTNDKEIAEKMHILCNHGMSRNKKYYHEVVGFNYRMTNMQAAIGVAQLEKIDEILTWRANLESEYRRKISNIPTIEPQRDDLEKRKKISWLVSMLVPEGRQEKIISKLKESGIDARAFFTPLSSMPIYEKYAVDCSISKKVARRGINLPTNRDVTPDIIDKIVSLLL